MTQDLEFEPLAAGRRLPYRFCGQGGRTALGREQAHAGPLPPARLLTGLPFTAQGSLGHVPEATPASGGPGPPVPLCPLPSCAHRRSPSDGSGMMLVIFAIILHLGGLCHEGSGLEREGPGRGEDHTCKPITGSPLALPAGCEWGRFCVYPSILACPPASGPVSTICRLDDPARSRHLLLPSGSQSARGPVWKPLGREGHIPVPSWRASGPLPVHPCYTCSQLSSALGGCRWAKPRTFPSCFFIHRGSGGRRRAVKTGLARPPAV